jgi:integrase
LLALFGHEGWLSREFLHPHFYWLMILGLYTGARINELCQLRLIDFIKVKGVDVISVADEDEEGKVRAKNGNARRRVPIHSELIRLGLLRWVKSRRAVGGTNLFDEIKPGRDGHGQDPSKWFGRYRKRCGILETQSKVFHSFRSGFISQLMNADVSGPKIAGIVGHEIGSERGHR